MVKVMKYDDFIIFDDFEKAILDGIIKDIQKQLREDTFMIYLGCKLHNYIVNYYFPFYKDPFKKSIAECRVIGECDYKLLTIDEYFE